MEKITKKHPKISVTKDGPYIVSGNLRLDEQIIVSDKDGTPTHWKQGKTYPKQENYSLCRCGKSKNKPFCDGSHLEAGFNGTETDSRKIYLERAEKLMGPNLDLTDAFELCAGAGFCERAGGTWQLVKDSGDPKSRKIAVQECHDCPSGRLIAWDKKTGKPIELKRKPSVSLTKNQSDEIEGPIWVKGNIVIEGADGVEYEARNQVTLCRCGKSKNKPFCDGSHIE